MAKRRPLSARVIATLRNKAKNNSWYVKKSLS